MSDDLRTLLLAVGTFFVVAFGAMTVTVIAETGFDFLTLISIVIISMVAFGLYGAWRNPPG